VKLVLILEHCYGWQFTQSNIFCVFGGGSVHRLRLYA
jgi:hypothetical protein